VKNKNFEGRVAPFAITFDIEIAASKIFLFAFLSYPSVKVRNI